MPQSRGEARSKHGPGDVERSLRDDNTRLQSENRKLRARSGDDKWLVEEISSRVESLGTLPTIKPAAKVQPGKQAYSRPIEAVLAIADPHMEEVVDPEETEGLAEWNFPMFLRSLWCVVNTTVELVNIMRANHVVDTLHVVFLGDMVTGEIHPDVFFSNAFYLPDALVAGPWYWGQAIRELSAHFEHLPCTCICGNHGRLDLKPTSKRAVGRNWDTCMYSNIAVQTRQCANVEFRIPRSPKCVIEVNGWYFLIQHGDRVAQHGGAMPYYGMARQRAAETAKRLGGRVRDVEKRLAAGLLFDYDMRGHHHIFGTTDERTLLCPSMMGNNEFGLDNTFAHKMPGARLFFVDEEHGMAGDWRINLPGAPDEPRFEPLPVWTGKGEKIC